MELGDRGRSGRPNPVSQLGKVSSWEGVSGGPWGWQCQGPTQPRQGVGVPLLCPLVWLAQGQWPEPLLLDQAKLTPQPSWSLSLSATGAT